MSADRDQALRSLDVLVGTRRVSGTGGGVPVFGDFSVTGPRHATSAS